MADLSRWFKLWCASVHDPDLDNLDIADFGRWAKLGAIIKEQGNGGKITINSPARLMCSSLQVSSFEHLINAIKKLPNVTVSSETLNNVSYTIEFKNWLKYQEDLSTDRVRKFRAKHVSNETPKKRGEERRREEKRREESKESKDTQRIKRAADPPDVKKCIDFFLPSKKAIREQVCEPVKAPDSVFVLPEWIDPKAWQGFEEMRKKIRKPMTDRARENIVRKLAAFKAKGHDPTTVLDNSITGDWQDVYEPKSEGGNGKLRDARSFHERAVDQNQRAKQEARLLLGVHRGGGGLGDKPNQGAIDREREGAISGEFEHVPEMETTETG